MIKHLWRQEWSSLYKWFLIAGLLLSALVLGKLTAGYLSSRILLLVAGGVVALLFLIFITNRMQLGLTLLVLAAPFLGMGFGTGTAVSINLAMVLAAGLLGLWLLRMLLQERRISLAFSPINLPLLAFVGAMLLAWGWGYVILDWRVALPDNILLVQAGQIALYTLLIGLYFLTANHPLAERTLRVWTYFLIAFGIGYYLANFLAVPVGSWIGTNPGMLLVWPMILLTAQALFNPNKNWLFLMLPVGMLWLAWILKFNIQWKSGWAPAIAGIGILILLRYRRKALVMGGIIMLLVVSAGFYQYILEPFTLNETISMERPLIWYDVVRLTGGSLLLGIGPVLYMYYWSIPGFIPYSRLSNWNAWNYWGFHPPSHNTFVDIYSQTGLIGLTFIVWALIAGVLIGWRIFKALPNGFLRGYVAGVVAGVLAVSLGSLIIGDYLMPFVYNIGFPGFRQALYAWLFLGSLVAIERQLKPQSVFPGER